MSKKTTLFGELKKQGGWLLQACTTDVLREATGFGKKKKKEKSHFHYHVNYHFYQNKKPRR